MATDHDDLAPATRGVVLRKAAAVYDWLSPPMMLGFEGRINRRAIRLLELRPGDRVLDLGCATGRVALAVAAHLDPARGGLAVGVDASPEMIAVARRKIRGRACRFDLAAAESLPYADASFDKAVSTMFFHHLAREDKLAALRQVHRVLRPGGLFVLVDVDPPTNWFGRLCTRSAMWLFEQPELRENIDGLLPGLTTDAGFAPPQRRGFDMGYVATFLLRKDEQTQRSCQ